MMIQYNPIGVAHSPFKEETGTPVQAAVAYDAEVTPEIFPVHSEGLKDDEGRRKVINKLYSETTYDVYELIDEEGNLIGIFAKCFDKEYRYCGEWAM